jgi:hypothetical protein
MFDKYSADQTAILPARRHWPGSVHDFTEEALCDRPRITKSILVVEIIGMVLLTLAWLSLNQYVSCLRRFPARRRRC